MSPGGRCGTCVLTMSASQMTCVIRTAFSSTFIRLTSGAAKVRTATIFQSLSTDYNDSNSTANCCSLLQSYGPCGLSPNIHHPHSQPHHGASCRSSILIPAFLSSSPESLVFSGQFAFRPTGSTTSAMVWFFHTITRLLTHHDYVMC